MVKMFVLNISSIDLQDRLTKPRIVHRPAKVHGQPRGRVWVQNAQRRVIVLVNHSYEIHMAAARRSRAASASALASAPASAAARESGADILPQLADADWETRHVLKPAPFLHISRGREIPLHVIGASDSAILVQLSTIEGLGNGLFAGKDFEAGEIVTGYSGLEITHAQATALMRRGLGSHIRSLWLMQSAIYGHKMPHKGYFGGSFVNHHASDANAEFFNIDTCGGCLRTVVIRTTRAVRAGEELFLNYGKTYFEQNRLEDATADSL